MRGKGLTCCFTGHRPTKLPWGFDEDDPRCLALKQRIDDAVEGAYEEGFRHFISGMALGCDLYFCESVLALRDRHSDVTVEAAVPCPEQTKRWSTADKARHQRLLEACNFETMVSHQYTNGCMQRRDRYMVDHADLLIAAYDGTSGGTQYTILYALKSKIPVVDLPIVI